MRISSKITNYGIHRNITQTKKQEFFVDVECYLNDFQFVFYTHFQFCVMCLALVCLTVIGRKKRERANETLWATDRHMLKFGEKNLTAIFLYTQICTNRYLLLGFFTFYYATACCTK